MSRRALIIAFAFLAAAISGTAFLYAQSLRQNKPPQTNNITGKQQLSGPYTHQNLTIFLIHGTDQNTDKPPLTLQEAMAQKKVIVHETGSVNELSIQNRSAEEVFVQAGDIVKGGQQDRVLALDLILPPKSGRISIEAFCVEHSRWSQRGNEAVAAFSASDKMLATKGLKLAARNSLSQAEVWENVSLAQEKLARNFVAAKEPPRPVSGNPVAMATPIPPPTRANPPSNPEPHHVQRVSGGVLFTPNAGLTLGEQQGLTSVTSRVSPTSLQLTLENKNVQESAQQYLNKLSSIVQGKSDVIGFVFAINGEFNSADVYSSAALFKKLWPKLLDASAVEAFAEYEANRAFAPVTKADASAFLREAESGKRDVKSIAPRTMLIKRETRQNLLFETRDRQRGDGWLHRNYLAK